MPSQHRSRSRYGAMSAEQSRFVACLAGHGSVKPARSWISIQSPSSWLPATRLGENSSSCLFFVELSQSRMIVLCLGQVLPNVRHRDPLQLFLSPSKEVMHPTAIE